jgi:hypothetical protein
MNGDVRLVEVSDAISVNGVVVTGRELRDRLGADAEAILKPYLEPAVRRALFAEAAAPALPARPPSPASAPATPDRDRDRDRFEHRSGDRPVRRRGGA